MTVRPSLLPALLLSLFPLATTFGQPATAAPPLYIESARAGVDTTGVDMEDTLATRLRREYARLSTDFWAPRITAYRATIDRSLSSTDLESLNKLRFRRLLLEMFSRNDDSLRSIAYGYDYGKMADTTATAMAPAPPPMPDTASAPDMAEADTVVVGVTATSDTSGSAVAPATRRSSIVVDVTSASDTSVIDTTVTIADATETEYREPTEEEIAEYRRARRASYRKPKYTEEQLRLRRELNNRERESTAIPAVVRTMVRAYPPVIAALRERMLADLALYADTLRGWLRRFGTENAEGLKESPTATLCFNEAEQSRRRPIVRMMKNPALFDRTYKSDLLSKIMLYSGEPVDRLLGDLYGYSYGYTGMLTSEALDTRPTVTPSKREGAMTIRWTARNSDTRSTIRIIDAEGEIVRTLEAAAGKAGERSIELDMENLPDGYYICQVEAETPNGPELLSTVMSINK